MAYILIAEDEEVINELIAKNLTAVGHKIYQTFTGTETLKAINENRFDLALLDVMMPGMNGFDVKRRIENDTPVIFVTAKQSLTDQLTGLSLGADDYITKPFDMLVLLARIENILRRTMKNTTIYRINNCVIDTESRNVKVNGEDVHLTTQEFNLLEALVINRNLALSREKLIELAWGFDFMGDNRTVDVHIQKIRKKCNLEKEIATVYKYGYRLEYKK
ncbi:MAG: response regulator transcription factor [Oscillospiraceae bacterium]|nr:response regulator transcription factor [Oscillospiraceae bacterium]MBR6609187.1 response regulator transcription factor [Oscillospiraceae bacterium]